MACSGACPSKTYGLLLLLGLSILFPWYAVITALDFFTEFYSLDDALLRRYSMPSLEYTFSVLYNIPCVAVILLQLWLRPQGRYSRRIIPSLLVNVVAMALMPSLRVLMGGSAHFVPDVALFVVLALVLCCGCCSGLLYSALFGYASLLPPICTQGLMFGITVSGALVAAVRVLTKVGLAGDNEASGSIYFATAAVVEAACVAGYLFLRRQHQQLNSGSGSGTGAAGASIADSAALPLHKNDILAGSADTWLLQSPPAGVIDTANMGDNIGGAAMPSSPADASSARLCTVLRKIYPHGTAVFLTFFTTLSLFPGVVVAIPAESSPFTGNDWYGVVLVTTFAFGDFFGRLIPGTSGRLVAWLSAPRRIIAAALGRILLFFVLFPMLALCVFRSDWAASFLLAAFAVSNGCLASVAMMAGSAVPELADHEKDLAGTLLTLFLNLGVALGSAAGWLVGYFIAGPATQHCAAA